MSETEATPEKTDPLKQYRALFGKPVAVQTVVQVPYLTVIPRLDQKGRPLLVDAGGDTLFGVPDVLPQPENYLVGVLRASECETLLVLEQRLNIDRGGEYAGGAGRLDVYIKPEIVVFVTIVKSIEDNRTLIVQ